MFYTGLLMAFVIPLDVAVFFFRKTRDGSVIFLTLSAVEYIIEIRNLSNDDTML